MTEPLVDMLSPLLDAAGLELVDVVVSASQVQVVVDCPGGVDLDALAEANRTLSAELDRLDPLPGSYTLEVSSPGLERRLRTPAHFARAIGETVSVRTLPDTVPLRRVRGVLVAADAEGFELEGAEVPGGSMRLRYEDVERARTVFEWRPGVPKGTRTVRGARRDGGRRHTQSQQEREQPGT